MSDSTFNLSELGDASVPLWLKPSARDTYLSERLAQLEDFIREDKDWVNLGAATEEQQLSRQGLQYIGHIARLMFLANPLINRGVSVKANYVWGRGVNISAKDDNINELIQQFLDDPRNQVELTSQPARIQKEIELQTDGNIFFAFIVHPLTGRVRVRSIPIDEVTDMITNPEDKKEVWFYKREWIEVRFDQTNGNTETQNKTAYYPDWEYRPDTMPTKIGTYEVINVPVYHVKIGGFSDWKFGVPEILSALDWAKSYTKFLKNWAALMQVYARFALKITTSGGSAGIATSKARVQSTISSSNLVERNPPPATGASFIRSQNTEGITQADVDVVRTAGATTSAEDGRRLLLMVAAAVGLPESFFGDVTGTFATAHTLDRPTELAFVNRQALWTYILHAIIDFICYCSVKAANGILNKAKIATITQNEYGENVVEWQGDVNAHVDIDFPSVIEHTLQEYVSAVKTAATLDGQTPTVLNDNRLLARMMLTALGENDIDEILDKLYPLDKDGNPIQPEPTQEDQLTNDLAQAAQAVQEALHSLRESILELSNTNITNRYSTIKTS